MYDYKTLKALMVGKEYHYLNIVAKIRYIDKEHCKKGFCNVMLDVPITRGVGTNAGFTITVAQLEKIYLGELSFDDILAK